jgi:carbamoyl-phosphate synthase small subunit
MSGEKAYLCLADGTAYEGVAWGAGGIATGEVVFTTGMTGYEEVLTDPSYCGQLVTMTAPQIGNTGVNLEDGESVAGAPQVAGFIVRDASASPSNYRAAESLHAYLARTGVVAISGVDTRALTRHLRDHGAQNGAIGATDRETLVRKARATPSMLGQDLVKRVTPKEPYAFTESAGLWGATPSQAPTRHVVAIDLGLKRNILRCLVDAGCRLTVVPRQHQGQGILSLKPDGVFVSNGPGDPAPVTYAVDTVKVACPARRCSGFASHQLLSLAVGAKTYKLKFGHRGVNQPVLDKATGKVEITTRTTALPWTWRPGRARHDDARAFERSNERGLAVPSMNAFCGAVSPRSSRGSARRAVFVRALHADDRSSTHVKRRAARLRCRPWGARG